MKIKFERKMNELMKLDEFYIYNKYTLIDRILFEFQKYKKNIID